MLLYFHKTYPVGIIRNIQNNYTYVIEDEKLVEKVAFSVYYAIKKNEELHEIIKVLQNEFPVIEEQKLLNKFTFTYPYNYNFYDEYGNLIDFYFNSAKWHWGNEYKIDGELVKIKQVSLHLNELAYIALILNWHVPKESFIPTARYYKDMISEVDDLIELRNPNKPLSRQLKKIKGRLINYFLKYISPQIRDVKFPKFYNGKLVSFMTKLDLPQEGVYRLYTIDINNKPFNIICLINTKLDVSNMYELYWWLQENPDIFDEIFLERLKRRMKDMTTPLKIKCILETNDYRIVRNKVKDLLAEDTYLPFFSNIDYEMEDTITEVVVKGSYQEPKVLNFFGNDISLIDRIKKLKGEIENEDTIEHGLH